MGVRKIVTGGLIIAGIAVGAGATMVVRSIPTSDSTPVATVPQTLAEAFPGIGALGRIEPRSRVLRLHPPTSMEGARIESMLVAEGQTVGRGEVVAILDVFGRRQAAVEEAQARVAVARAQLDRVRAGNKPGDIAAQDAMVLKAATGLKNAELELKRSDSLSRTNAISAQEVEERRLRVDSEKMVLSQARNVLQAMREVRSVDIKFAEAELLGAESSVRKMEADLEAARVRAPIEGTILKIHARVGERVADAGVADIGDLSAMYAVAEVYEADILRVRIGRSVRLKVGSFDGELLGVVEEISLRVGRKVVLNNDPVADTDARVVEVRIRIAESDSERVRGLSNARVQVVIDGEPDVPPAKGER